MNRRKGKEKSSDNDSKVELPISLSPSKNFANKRHDFDKFKKNPSKEERELGLIVGWDFENARIPLADSENLREKVLTGLRKLRKGYDIKHFFGYGSRKTFTEQVFTRLRMSGITIHYTDEIKTVRNSDIGDYRIIEDMLIHAIDFRPPGNLLFITSDQDFSRPMAALKNRGFVVLVAHLNDLTPQMRGSSSAGWHWQSLYKGLNQAFINAEKKEQHFDDTNECEELFNNTVVAAVHIAWILLFVFVFAYGIKFLNLQRR